MDDGEVVDRRALNRALLARQHLLARVERPVADEVEHLVGLQAQSALPPYLGLLARLRDFDPHELGRMLVDREVVRLTLHRGTVHLVTVRDALWLRPLLQVAAVRGHRGVYGRRMGDARPEDVVAAVREELAPGEARTARELARRLVARGIGTDVEALADAVRAHVALVQVPPRGVWGAGGQARYLPLEAWAGARLHPDPSADELVLRHLRAFGPASVADVQRWSGLTRLAPVLARLRPRLLVLRDEDGRELFDLPDAPRPDPGVAAPVRLLGEYDNVLLGHDDRRRIVPEGFPWRAMLAPGRFVHNLLVDGTLRATWWVEREGRRRATLAIRPAGALRPAEAEEVHEEARRVLDVLEPRAAARVVRLEPAV